MKKISLKMMLFILCASSFMPNEFCSAKLNAFQSREERKEKRKEKYMSKISKLGKRSNIKYVTRVEPSINSEQLPITIIVYAQDTADWVAKNLDSVLKQQYQNYRLIYINDGSIDATEQNINAYISTHTLPCNITVITNETTVGRMASLYEAIHSCNDNEIIALLDGHDWLANEWVLANLNKEYTSRDIWLTFGTSTSEPKGCNIGLRNGTVPDEILQKRYFRKIFPYMPLRTFYAWLFKQINEEDLIDPTTNDFFEHAAECYIMWPLMEMASTRFKIFNEITYVVNCNDPIAKLIEDYHLRMACNSQMGKDLPVYQPISNPLI